MMHSSSASHFSGRAYVRVYPSTQTLSEPPKNPDIVKDSQDTFLSLSTLISPVPNSQTPESSPQAMARRFIDNIAIPTTSFVDAPKAQYDSWAMSNRQFSNYVYFVDVDETKLTPAENLENQEQLEGLLKNQNLWLEG